MDVKECFGKYRLKIMEALKVLFLVCVCLGLYLFSSEVGDKVKSLRLTLADVPTTLVIALVLIVQYVRRCVPPLYPLFGPFSTLVLLVFSDKFGSVYGALFYQLMKTEELLVFWTLRRCYTNSIETILDLSTPIWWLSDTFRSGLLFFDKTYVNKIRDKPYYIQVFSVWVFNMTYFFNDYISVFWFATRSQLPYYRYCYAYCFGLILEFPKTLFKFKAYTGLLDASTSSDGSFWSVLTHTSDFQWWEVLILGVTTGLSTLYVHGTHLSAIVVAIYRRLCGPSLPKPLLMTSESSNPSDAL